MVDQVEKEPIKILIVGAGEGFRGRVIDGLREARGRVVVLDRACERHKEMHDLSQFAIPHLEVPDVLGGGLGFDRRQGKGQRKRNRKNRWR